ncbi:MAG TPA: DUF4402 domain-containing protein [Dysgonamonadaceae bacterium]|jgi:hypothetical protein|nr:DUF4402 domain-containing protein [Dysgonamonadaceae bacterium]
MRKLLFRISLLAVMACATQKMNAQVSATAETTAKIVSGLQITKEADLNFGSMFSPTSGGGTVTVDVNNQRTATGVQLATVSGEAITAAQFKVTGNPNATFTITFPYSFSVTNTNGSGSSMLVDAFTYNNITSPSTLDGSGNLTIKVGARLNVYNYQAVGIYKNTSDLKITVAYN